MNAKVDVPAPSDVPATIRATIRGTTYTVSELPMNVYNELLEKATTKVRNDITGLDEEEIDQQLLGRLMMAEAVTPKPAMLKLGVRHYRAINRLINELHFGDEPVKIEKDEEDSPKGNA